MQTEVSSVAFDLWIKDLIFLEIDLGILYFAAPSVMAKTQITKHYMPALWEVVKKTFPTVRALRILNPQEAEQHTKEKEGIRRSEEAAEEENRTQLTANKFPAKYSFENFIVGQSNQVVYAAAHAVAEHPGIKFNPLFIYGGTGLGKTHLLYAIGNYITANNPDLKICYTTCEKFTNEYIDSLSKGASKGISGFREKYRNMDVLLIDDIQFLINKTSTQEEFFHTFNELFTANKQIVITSDRNPKELQTLEERLRSRFVSGLIQDIQSPEFETRLAILRKKVELENYQIDSYALTLIAENINSNIRELEGILQKVCFFATLSGKKKADINDVNEALKENLTIAQKELSADHIIDAVCKFYKISREDITSKKKTKEIVEPRQICAYLICEMIPTLPLIAIGSKFGGRDHTTIIHSRDKIAKLKKTDKKTTEDLEKITAMVYENIK